MGRLEKVSDRFESFGVLSIILYILTGGGFSHFWVVGFFAGYAIIEISIAVLYHLSKKNVNLTTKSH